MNIILTTNMDEEPVDADHQFVTVGPNCWGIGRSAGESFKNAKANAPHGYRGNYLTRVSPIAGFQIDPIDGSVLWSSEHDAKNCKLCTVGKGIRVSTK